MNSRISSVFGASRCQLHPPCHYEYQGSPPPSREHCAHCVLRLIARGKQKVRGPLPSFHYLPLATSLATHFYQHHLNKDTFPLCSGSQLPSLCDEMCWNSCSWSSSNMQSGVYRQGCEWLLGSRCLEL